jgi:hypothetical protein
LRITRQRYGVGMCRRGVLVHCPSRLRAAVAVLTLRGHSKPANEGHFKTGQRE